MNPRAAPLLSSRVVPHIHPHRTVSTATATFFPRSPLLAFPCKREAILRNPHHRCCSLTGPSHHLVEFSWVSFPLVITKERFL
ncbi:hypothetical protein OPV22_025192 [Ensete ventricosum]|uniref:Uncharacterized protein n=1 Tax=Ensete ventricosum TaxID=4639 RepID=A0AAV8Q359_ENSVE|nr:hypothetical protein OPV22_025192 [Ensete ventricosum]